ncbi:MAG: hypothetical protein JSS39_14545 [Nitrospira sp.]|nr:hypothetical protein [Nitrospira sp.]
MAIAHGGLNIGVAEELFHRHKIDARHDATAGGSMSQRVPARPLDTGLPKVLLEDALRERAGIERLVWS